MSERREERWGGEGVGEGNDVVSGTTLVGLM